jgi:hypothetical protein
LIAVTTDDPAFLFGWAVAAINGSRLWRQFCLRDTLHRLGAILLDLKPPAGIGRDPSDQDQRETARLVIRSVNRLDVERIRPAVKGPLKGTQLKPLILIPEFWFAWSQFRPGTSLFSTSTAEPSRRD